jgi:hypothetical protein
MFVSFLWSALAVAAFLWVDKPWYNALAIGVSVFFIGAVARSLFRIATRTTIADAVDKALKEARHHHAGIRTAASADEVEKLLRAARQGQNQNKKLRVVHRSDKAPPSSPISRNP